GSSRNASGRDETTIVVPQYKNHKNPSAWIPPSALKRDALLRPSLNSASNVNINTTQNNNSNYNKPYSQQHRLNYNNQKRNYTNNSSGQNFLNHNIKTNYYNNSHLNKEEELNNNKLNDNDDVFRKCRGLLNRLSPDNFEKLSIDFCSLQIKNLNILKAVTALICEKALNEPAYSSLYAQLCQRLDKHVPNFDNIQQSPTNTPQISTFRKLLLTNCQHEFDNRANYIQIPEIPPDQFKDNDDEKKAYIDYVKQTGKKKMLGNIRFIAELGKLDLLSEAIMHKCIKTLLEKNKLEKYTDMSDDLECLCKMMPTIGKKLDQNEAKKLMDQYFERMVKLKSINGKDCLPSRIKFLIQDCIDLRKNNWELRRIQTEQQPQKITELIKNPAETPNPTPQNSNPFYTKMYQQINNQPNMTLLNAINSFSKNKVTIQSPYSSFYYQDEIDDVSSNASSSSSQTDLNKKDEIKSNFVPLNYTAKPSQRLVFQAEKTRSNSSSSISAMSSTSSVAPSVSPPINDTQKKQFFYDQEKSILLKPLNNLLLNNNLKNEENFYKKKVEHFLENYLKHLEINFDEIKLENSLEKFIFELICLSLTKRTDSDRLNISKLITKVQKGLERPSLFETSLKLILDNLSKLEQEHHCVKSNVSIYICRGLIDGLIELKYLAQMMINGAYYPLFFIILQQLLKLRIEMGASVDESKEFLRKMVNLSGVNLIDMLPDNGDRNRIRLGQLLDDRELGFIRPMIKYEDSLYSKISLENLDCGLLKKWIEENFDRNLIESNDFVNCLITCIVKNSVEKSIADRNQVLKQRELIVKYDKLMQEYLNSNANKKVQVLYAIKSYAETNAFPQYLLTNLLNQFYELNLIDHETFKNL
ncbi:unnamed protein product, partial [Brachionus calyciflorus]